MSIFRISSTMNPFQPRHYDKAIDDIIAKIRSVVRAILSSISAPIDPQKRIMTKMLNGEDVRLFVESQTDQSTTFVHEFLSTSAIKNEPGKISEILDTAIKSDKLVFMPFVLKGFINHIVILTIDPKNQTIEYYNSQGGDIKEENRELVGCDINCGDFLKLIKEKCPDWTIKSNKTKHQKDLKSCGAFVCWFMKQRKTRSFAEICSTPRKQIDVQGVRAEIADLLPEQSTSKHVTVEDDFNLI